MKRVVNKVIWLLISITLFASIVCQKDEWLDNGVHYFCPDCRDKAYVDVIGACERCDEMTASISFMYCYDCAKEIDACQRCGVER